MSLSTWEQQALDSIRKALAGSDPTLAARLAIFTRLASGEEMPASEKLRPGSRRPAPRTRPGAPAAQARRLGVSHMMLLLWLVTSVTLISVAFALNRPGGTDTCHGYWAALCGGSTSASQSAGKLP